MIEVRELQRQPEALQEPPADPGDGQKADHREDDEEPDILIKAASKRISGLHPMISGDPEQQQHAIKHDAFIKEHLMLRRINLADKSH